MNTQQTYLEFEMIWLVSEEIFVKKFAASKSLAAFGIWQSQWITHDYRELLIFNLLNCSSFLTDTFFCGNAFWQWQKYLDYKSIEMWKFSKIAPEHNRFLNQLIYDRCLIKLMPKQVPNNYRNYFGTFN